MDICKNCFVDLLYSRIDFILKVCWPEQQQHNDDFLHTTTTNKCFFPKEFFPDMPKNKNRIGTIKTHTCYMHDNNVFSVRFDSCIFVIQSFSCFVFRWYIPNDDDDDDDDDCMIRLYLFYCSDCNDDDDDDPFKKNQGENWNW